MSRTLSLQLSTMERHASPRRQHAVEQTPLQVQPCQLSFVCALGGALSAVQFGVQAAKHAVSEFRDKCTLRPVGALLAGSGLTAQSVCCPADVLMLECAQGGALLAAQFGAQAAKRAVSTLRDRRTLFWQLAVPVLLVALSQATNRAAFRLETPPLVISRCACRLCLGSNRWQTSLRSAMHVCLCPVSMTGVYRPALRVPRGGVQVALSEWTGQSL